MCREQALGNIGKSDKEGDTEEPWEGKDPDHGLEMEEQISTDRSIEKYRVKGVQLGASLPVRTGEQYNLSTGCAQHLLGGQLSP